MDRWLDGNQEALSERQPATGDLRMVGARLRRWVVAGRRPHTCDQAVVMAACMEVVMNGLGGGGGQESQDNFCTGSCVATLTVAFDAQCSDGGDGDISELLASAESIQPYAVRMFWLCSSLMTIPAKRKSFTSRSFTGSDGSAGRQGARSKGERARGRQRGVLNEPAPSSPQSSGSASSAVAAAPTLGRCHVQVEAAARELAERKLLIVWPGSWLL